MKRVQLALIGATLAGGAAVGVLLALAQNGRPAPLPELACIATFAYLLVSNVLLLRGLRRRHSASFGAANVVTAIRSTFVGVITGLVVASFAGPIPIALLVGLTVSALTLDAVDGWVARRTGSSSELGARFDMEVDAFLLLVLSTFVAQSMGAWVLAIGLMRYAFVVAGWFLPWFRRKLPSRYWRKVVTAVQGIALTVAATGLFPGIAIAFVILALGLLVESFGRDVVWLARRRRAATTTLADGLEDDETSPRFA